MIDIRAATPDDLAEVDALLARSYPKLLRPDYPPSVMVTALPLIARAQPVLLASGTYYVALSEGVIVGAGGWTRDRKRADLGHIRHVVTDDRQTRRGIGRSLMQHSFEMAAAAGMTELECWSTHTGVSFYRSLGFEVVGPIDVELQPRVTFPSVRLTRSLEQP